MRTDAAPDDARNATLQDFWRAEEGRLIHDPTDPNRRFTIAHAPARWLNQEPEKASWNSSRFSEITDALRAALDRLPSGAFDAPQPSRRSGRTISGSSEIGRLLSIWPVPLNGIVIDQLPSLALDFDLVLARQIAVLGPIDIVHGGRMLEFGEALFGHDLSVAGENVDLRLRRALCAGDVEMFGGQLRRFAAPSATFLGGVDLTSVTVADTCSLSKVTFYGDVSFENATVKSVQLASSVFLAELSFTSAQIGKINCEAATFQGEFTADAAQIAILLCDRATFGGDASFQSAGLERGSFLRTTWERPANFANVRGYVAVFNGAQFKNEVSFEHAQFKNKVIFASVQFEQTAKFDQMIWPSDAAAIGQVFREARFKGYASFLDNDFWIYAAFDGAKLDAEVRMSRQSFIADKGLCLAMERATDEEKLEQLEHGLRNLKLCAESIRDRELEHRYYAYQLRVRRKSKPDRIQGGALAVYALISNYGLSLGRPLLWLVGIWALCAVIFLILGAVSGDPTTAGIGLKVGPVHPATWEALEMSARGIFSLLGTWSLRPPTDAHNLPDLEAALLWRHPGIGFLVRLIWSIEAVCAGVLLFLAALSVRRWFQIS